MTTGYLGDSGIVLNGPADTDGVTWGWTGADPWSPSPAPRAVTGERATDHGAWDATRFYGPRSYALEGRARAKSHTALHAAKHRLFAACGLRGFTFRVVEPGFDRQATFRRDGEVMWSELADLKTAQFSVPMWAGDPRVYSTASRSRSVAFPATAGGLTWPATWPATWSAVVTAGDMQLVNAGNEDAWPVYRIDGPVVNPTIVNAGTGEAMHLELTLAAGEWVVLDTGSHQVLANGDTSASRRDKFWGDWWPLRPGQNTVRFAGGSAGAGAQLTVTYNDVWI